MCDNLFPNLHKTEYHIFTDLEKHQNVLFYSNKPLPAIRCPNNIDLESSLRGIDKKGNPNFCAL